MRRNSEKGFSLIELSIVLIIIGLLIAGITGGASLVKSATVRAVISEANSFNSAVNAYYAKRSNLPGDDATQASGNNGDGNGRIEYINIGGFYEGTAAWRHLSTEDIVEGSFTSNGVDPDVVPGTHIPVSKLSAAGWAADFKNGMNMLVLSNPEEHIEFASGTSAGKLVSTNVISAENAKSIDTKMDDGASSTGKVRGYTADLTPGAEAESAMNYDATNKSTPSGYMGFATAL